MWRHTWTYLEAISGSYVGRLRIIAIVRTYDFYLNSTNSHADHDHVRVTTIERLDQGHLYPLGEQPGDMFASAGDRTALQAGTLPKELSRQLIS